MIASVYFLSIKLSGATQIWGLICCYGPKCISKFHFDRLFLMVQCDKFNKSYKKCSRCRIYLYIFDKFNKISLPNWNNCCLITKYISLEIETWKRNKRSDTSHKIFHPELSVTPSCQYQLWLAGAGAIMAACNLFRLLIVFSGTWSIALWAARWLTLLWKGIYTIIQIRGKQINIYRNHPAVITRKRAGLQFFFAALCKW